MLSNVEYTFIVNINKLKYFNIGYNELTQLPTNWLPNIIDYLYIMGNCIY